MGKAFAKREKGVIAGREEREAFKDEGGDIKVGNGKKRGKGRKEHEKYRTSTHCPLPNIFSVLQEAHKKPKRTMIIYQL
jgi:hypothetical protein